MRETRTKEQKLNISEIEKQTNEFFKNGGTIKREPKKTIEQIAQELQAKLKMYEARR